MSRINVYIDMFLLRVQDLLPHKTFALLNTTLYGSYQAINQIDEYYSKLLELRRKFISILVHRK